MWYTRTRSKLVFKHALLQKLSKQYTFSNMRKVAPQYGCSFVYRFCYSHSLFHFLLPRSNQTVPSLSWELTSTLANWHAIIHWYHVICFKYTHQQRETKCRLYYCRPSLSTFNLLWTRYIWQHCTLKSVMPYPMRCACYGNGNTLLIT